MFFLNIVLEISAIEVPSKFSPAPKSRLEIWGSFPPSTVHWSISSSPDFTTTTLLFFWLSKEKAMPARDSLPLPLKIRRFRRSYPVTVVLSIPSPLSLIGLLIIIVLSIRYSPSASFIKLPFGAEFMILLSEIFFPFSGGWIKSSSWLLFFFIDFLNIIYFPFNAIIVIKIKFPM